MDLISELPSLEPLDFTDLVFRPPFPPLFLPLVEDEVHNLTGEGELENTPPESNVRFLAVCDVNVLVLLERFCAELSVELLVDLYEGVGVSSDGDSSKSSSSSISGNGDCCPSGRGELKMGSRESSIIEMENNTNMINKMELYSVYFILLPSRRNHNSSSNYVFMFLYKNRQSS